MANLIFITTDEITAKPLTKFDSEARGVITQFSEQSKSNINYGTVEYFSLIVERPEIQYSLLMQGINVFIIESDATWLENATRVKSFSDLNLQSTALFYWTTTDLSEH